MSASLKTLVAGWFSFEGMGVSAGDLLARDLACDWLRQVGAGDDSRGAKWAVEGAPADPHVSGVRIATRLDVANVLRTPSEVESLIARMDLVLTTRLHGMVLALKHGVPAVAVDPVV